MTKVFLSGGTGLIGNAIALSILDRLRGSQIVMPYRSDSGVFHDLEAVSYTKADLSDVDSVKRLAAGCDVAVLAAATTGGASQSKKEPWRQVTNNILIDATCLQAMYDVGIRHLVYISSATVYQDFEGSIKECQIDYSQDPIDAHFGVGWAKRSSEKICEFWSRQGMKIVVLRVANAYGPFAQFSDQNANVIASLIKRFCSAAPSVSVWGSPQTTRDFLYVGDLAEFVSTLLVSEWRPGMSVYNVGGGKSSTIEELVQSIIAATSFAGDHAFTDDQATPKAIKRLDISKSFADHEWRPRTSLSQGIAQTVLWWRQNRDEWKR